MPIFMHQCKQHKLQPTLSALGRLRQSPGFNEFET